MKPQVHAYTSLLLKADQRGLAVHDHVKCYSTLNYGAYQEPSRQPFGTLEFFNDLYLAPGTQVSHPLPNDVAQLLIPITGTLSYAVKGEVPLPLSAEEFMFVSRPEEGTCQVRNPYPGHTINYLQIGLRQNNPGRQPSILQPIRFEQSNALASLGLEKLKRGAYASAGVYSGRSKDRYALNDSRNGVFIYIVNGAFEVEDRLLSHRDALALWDIDGLEFEALSEHAVMLLFEIPLHI